MSAQLHLFFKETNHQAALKKIIDLKWENNPDLLEFNHDGTGLKIDQVRDLINQLPYRPYSQTKRYFIIYHFDQTTNEAQNALLKSLEEPPEFVEFILTAQNLQSILPTIQSRCLIHHHANQKKQDKAIKNKLATLYQQITNSDNYSELMELAAQNKDRQETIDLITDLINDVEEQNQLQPTLANTLNLRTLDKHLNYLKQNSNVVLTLESAFFEIKNNVTDDPNLVRH